MTIQAQPTQRRPQRRSSSAEHSTLGHLAPAPGAVDNLRLLDHRTRRRTVPLEAATPGRYLSVEHGDEVHLIPLDQPIVHIGRGLTADIRIEDPHVSRRHAIVAQRGDGVRVLDDRSFNGTVVNGRQITTAYLNDGDVLRLGRVAFRFVEIEPHLEPTPPLRRIVLPMSGRRLALVGATA